jgi:hypothetical protein
MDYFSNYFLTLVDIAPLNCSANFGPPVFNNVSFNGMVY